VERGIRGWRLGLFLTVLLTAIQGQAKAAGRILLRDSVVARREMLTLSDLLPAETSTLILISAAEIRIGPAPLAGTHRILTHAEVERAMSEAPLLRHILEVPDIIDVTRWSRGLQPAEVQHAIEEEFHARDLQVRISLPGFTLSNSSRRVVTEDSPKLKVTRIERDRNRECIRARVSIVSEPRVPPFWVELPGEIPLQPSQQPLNVVRKGKPVELVYEGHAMRIVARAIALDDGPPGRNIRVRNLDSRKIVTATVAAPGRVEVRF